LSLDIPGLSMLDGTDLDERGNAQVVITVGHAPHIYLGHLAPKQRLAR
jgi:hypothetical protein